MSFGHCNQQQYIINACKLLNATGCSLFKKGQWVSMLPIFYFTPTPATPSSGSFSTCHLPAHLLDLSSGNLHQETPRYFGPKTLDVHLPGLQWVPWAVINCTDCGCVGSSARKGTPSHMPLFNYMQTIYIYNTDCRPHVQKWKKTTKDGKNKWSKEGRNKDKNIHTMGIFLTL